VNAVLNIVFYENGVFFGSSPAVTVLRGFPLHEVICMGLYIPRNIC